MTRHALKALWLVLVATPGCFVQGGAFAGTALHASRPAAASWGGQLVAGVQICCHLQAGVELQGRAEHLRGSRFDVGLQVLATTGDPQSPVRIGAQLDAGLRAGWSAAAGGYLGGALELPLALETPPPIAERNRNFRILGSQPWLVPFVRYRYYGFERAQTGAHEIAGGVALRVHYASDWF